MPDGTIWSQPPTYPYICPLSSSFLPDFPNTLLSLGSLTGPTKQAPLRPRLPFPSLIHPFSSTHPFPAGAAPLYRSVPALSPLSCSFCPRSQPGPGCFAPLRAFPPCRGRCPSSPPWQDAGSAGPCCFPDSKLFPGNGYGCCGCDAYDTLRELCSGHQPNAKCWELMDENSRVCVCVSQGTRSHAAWQAQKGLMGAPEEPP